MNSGIDCSRGTTNIDPENQIRFGYIHANYVSYWNDESEADFSGEIDCDEVVYVYKEDGYKAYQPVDDVDIIIEKSPFYTYAAFASPCFPGGGCLDTPFRIPKEDQKPNYRTTAEFLTEQKLWDVLGGLIQDLAKSNGFPKVYCFGHDWFKKSAPYHVFEVGTDKFVPFEEIPY
jgi:hypothetical protein